LIALEHPALAGLVQPLAGEWAVRRSLFESLAVPTGYAVELAALVDTLAACGLDAIAQVDLGRRAHRHQDLHDLGAMATQILAAMRSRAPASGSSASGSSASGSSASGAEAAGAATPGEVVLRQYRSAATRLAPRDRVVPLGERPPARGVA
jgi:glucosyl-3-phosphoglycerate synthase